MADKPQARLITSPVASPAVLPTKASFTNRPPRPDHLGVSIFYGWLGLPGLPHSQYARPKVTLTIAQADVTQRPVAGDVLIQRRAAWLS